MLVRLDQRASARERKARYRKRLKSGGAVLRVPTRDLNALISALLALRWLDESKSEDREQVAVAVGALHDDFVTRLSRVGRQTIGRVPPSLS
jgi:hypothetical protein